MSRTLPRPVRAGSDPGFRVRCGDGELKTIRFQPVTLSDGNQYVTYDEAAGGTPAL